MSPYIVFLPHNASVVSLKGPCSRCPPSFKPFFIPPLSLLPSSLPTSLAGRGPLNLLFIKLGICTNGRQGIRFSPLRAPSAPLSFFSLWFRRPALQLHPNSRVRETAGFSASPSCDLSSTALERSGRAPVSTVASGPFFLCQSSRLVPLQTSP